MWQSLVAYLLVVLAVAWLIRTLCLPARRAGNRSVRPEAGQRPAAPCGGECAGCPGCPPRRAAGGKR